jgi:hypothetical protein
MLQKTPRSTIANRIYSHNIRDGWTKARTYQKVNSENSLWNIQNVAVEKRVVISDGSHVAKWYLFTHDIDIQVGAFQDVAFGNEPGKCSAPFKTQYVVV